MTTDEIIAAIYRKELTREQAIGEVKASLFELNNELTATGYDYGVYESLKDRFDEILGFVPLPDGGDNPHDYIATKPETEESRTIGDKLNQMINLALDVESAKWLLKKLETERFSEFFPTPMSPDSKTELQIRQAMLRGDMSPQRALGEVRATLAEIDWKFKFEIGADSISSNDWYENRIPDYPECPDLQDSATYSYVVSAMHSNLNYVERFEKQAMKIGWDPREIQGLKILEKQLKELVLADKPDSHSSNTSKQEDQARQQKMETLSSCKAQDAPNLDVVLRKKDDLPFTNLPDVAVWLLEHESEIGKLTDKEVSLRYTYRHGTDINSASLKAARNGTGLYEKRNGRDLFRQKKGEGS